MGRGLARNGEAQWTGRSVSAETLTGVFWHARRVHGEQRRAGGDCGELSQLECWIEPSTLRLEWGEEAFSAPASEGTVTVRVNRSIYLARERERARAPRHGPTAPHADVRPRSKRGKVEYSLEYMKVHVGFE